MTVTAHAPAMAEGAVYWADNGQRVCAACAGATARFTGRDVSGHPVQRVTIEDVQAWPEDLGDLACESGCTTLSRIAGSDGWPLSQTGGAA